jgi:cysteinyl-tRNA synthetase
MKKKCRKILFACLPVTLLLACSKNEPPAVDYRNEMRDFVQLISRNARAVKPDFLVIPQNGLALLSSDGTAQGSTQSDYIQAINGVGQEELFYGYDNNDDQLTPEPEHTEMLSLCRFARDHGLTVLVIDYAASPDKVTHSWQANRAENFLPFVADHRDLDDIPANSPAIADSADIDSLGQAQSFLYLISPGAFESKEQFISRLAQTPDDILLVDLFFDGQNALSASDLDRLRVKPQGGRRKLICYMSIGEAERYRYYWKPSWDAVQPGFIVGEDPDWTDNYYVRYWSPEWQQTICGPGDSYLSRVIAAGFDGVYLDLVSAYEYFEE